MKRVIVGVTGASGSIYSQAIMRRLHEVSDVELHVVATKNGKDVFKYETGLDFDQQAQQYAHELHDNNNMFASIASGSFKTEGMIIVPCSMSTVAKLAEGIAETLLCRAADVCIKERRRLVICPRETPLSTVHLRNMLTAGQSGAIIFPCMPAFYTKPSSIEDIVENSICRVLGMFGIDCGDKYEWGEVNPMSKNR